VSRYARHRGRGWVTSVPAMAGVEGVVVHRPGGGDLPI